MYNVFIISYLNILLNSVVHVASHGRFIFKVFGDPLSYKRFVKD